MSSLEKTADQHAWAHACELVSRQLGARAAHIERTPQDAPQDRWQEPDATAPGQPSPSAAGQQSPTAEEKPPSAGATNKAAQAGTKTPSQADIEAVIAMLSHGDEAFAASLRARLDQGQDGV